MSEQRDCLIVILGDQVRLAKGGAWPIASFISDGKCYRDCGFGEFTEFYDWLRNYRGEVVEAAQVTVRSLPEWRSKYLHLMMRRGRKTAKVAMARKLAVRLYWMMRKEWDYQQVKKFGSHAGQPGNRHGVQ